MVQVKAYYDREGNTLTVWFGDPTDEHVVEETVAEHSASQRPLPSIEGCCAKTLAELEKQMSRGVLLSSQLQYARYY